MTVRTSVKAARLALGTQALVTATSLADKMSPTTKDVVTQKMTELPDGSGYKLVPHYEQVTTPGLPFDQAIGDAAVNGLKGAAIATGAYLAVKGGQKLHAALGKQWRRGK
jgi:hypothetical protein